MGDYVELPGVRTWYDTDGAEDAEPLLLLHGGLCTNETWGGQRADLAAVYRLFLPERRAHGHTPDVDGPLSYGDMADDTADFIDTVVKGPAHLVGWSDGGIVALLVALARPDLVRKIVTIGANFRPAPEIAAEPAMLEHMTDDSPDMAHMFAVEPVLTAAELSRITAPTLVMTGDDDMMTLEHTIDLYRAIPHSQLAVVPGTSHAALMEKPALVNTLILDFLTKDPTPTMFPIRRAAGSQPTGSEPVASGQ
jgi:pimeloyl-ACP methyl ester carboxylesterase